MWGAPRPEWGFALVLLLGAATARGEEAAQPEAVTIRKTKDGLNFQLPPDWPLEKRGGIMAPIPIEEYLARKFKALEGQLQGLEQRFNGLDVRLRVVEEALKGTPRKGLVSVEPTGSPSQAIPPAGREEAGSLSPAPE